MVIARVSAALLMLAGLAVVPLFFLQASGQPSPDLLRLAAGGLWRALGACHGTLEALGPWIGHRAVVYCQFLHVSPPL